MGSSSTADHEISSGNALKEIRDNLTSFLHQQGGSTSHLTLRDIKKLCDYILHISSNGSMSYEKSAHDRRKQQALSAWYKTVSEFQTTLRHQSSLNVDVLGYHEHYDENIQGGSSIKPRNLSHVQISPSLDIIPTDLLDPSLSATAATTSAKADPLANGDYSMKIYAHDEDDSGLDTSSSEAGGDDTEGMDDETSATSILDG